MFLKGDREGEGKELRQHSYQVTISFQCQAVGAAVLGTGGGSRAAGCSPATAAGVGTGTVSNAWRQGGAPQASGQPQVALGLGWSR